MRMHARASGHLGVLGCGRAGGRLGGGNRKPFPKRIGGGRACERTHTGGRHKAQTLPQASEKHNERFIHTYRIYSVKGALVYSFEWSPMCVSKGSMWQMEAHALAIKMPALRLVDSHVRHRPHLHRSPSLWCRRISFKGMWDVYIYINIFIWSWEPQSTSMNLPI